ncbi:hypothetical protein WA1_26720 [Scytonema hofmannii PCC 7110]|uniref:Uncharacterized protein n=2 Tax=Scytonema hofmannii TaxID=34078 RepID=A0A139X6S5_9CYAN|nr:hypothetical protein WA1_26720 [Scytonema hofmannii PCC 7110]
MFNDGQDNFSQEHFNQVEISDEALQMIALITDEQEYREQLIDSRLQWISDNDPHSHLKNFYMVDCQCEINFFLSRKQELVRERDGHIHHIKQQYEQELQQIQTVEPPESDVPIIGPEHLVKERIQQWREQELCTKEKKCHKDIQIIADRYNRLQEQCDQRIHQASTNYQEALRLWREEHNKDI